MPKIYSTANNLDIELQTLQVVRESINDGFDLNSALGNASNDLLTINGNATLNNNITFNNQIVYSLGISDGPGHYLVSLGGNNLVTSVGPVDPGPLDNTYYSVPTMGSTSETSQHTYELYAPGSYVNSVITITNNKTNTDVDISRSVLRPDGTTGQWTLTPGGWVTLVETTTSFIVVCYYNP